MRMNGRHIRPLPVTSLPSGPSRRLRTQRLALTLLLIVALPLASSRPNPAGAATHDRQGVAPIGVSAAILHSMWANAGQVRVRATPGGQILTELDLDQEVQVTGAPRIFAGAAWLPVDLWGALPGYVAARLLSRAPTEVPFAPGPGVQIPTPSGPHVPMPLHARARTRTPAPIHTAPSDASPITATLPTGRALAVTAWATDRAGEAWYAVRGKGHAGWVRAEAINLEPAGSPANLALLRGTGMWLTPAVLSIAPPAALVEAARMNGITHLYVEVASSHNGGRFANSTELGRLLPIAHRAHIAVIAWVYPLLADLPDDVAAGVEAATYTAPSGDRADGLAADIESNLEEPIVRAYGQILRARLGRAALMVATVYPPNSYWGQRTPFRAIAQSFDLIAPMDYWHLRARPYGAADAYAYVRQSISDIREATGDPVVPIEVLGQMFDLFGDGHESPCGAEIQAAWQATHDERAEGISFFEWNHATPEEWAVLRQLARQ